MRTLELKGGDFALVDDEDYASVVAYRWRVNQGYVVSGDNIHLHRLLMNPKSGLEVDHRDGNKLNNQRGNLRIVTHSENGKNLGLSVRSKTGIKGVHWVTSKRLFGCIITSNYKRHFLGYFKTKEEASLAYNQASQRLHGDFRRLA